MMEQSAPQPLVLQGGVLLDPKNGVHQSLDVAVQNGRVLEVGEGLAGRLPFRVIDVGGLLVTPALMDLHTHLFATLGLRDAWAGDESVLPDGFSFRTGVTTMVDAGSAGWRNFDTFRVSVIDRARTRVFAFLNIAGFGMISDMIEQDPRDFVPQIAANTIRKHRDVLVGVKSAHYQGPDWSSVERAVEAGELAGVPVMVDFGYFRRERPYWRLVTSPPTASAALCLSRMSRGACTRTCGGPGSGACSSTWATARAASCSATRFRPSGRRSTRTRFPRTCTAGA
jgi:dihydroorotase